MLSITKRFALAMSAAPLLALSQAFDSAGPLALVAFTPWLWAAQKSSFLEALVTGAAIGTLYGCIWASWIPEALQGLGASDTGAGLGLILAAAWSKLPLFALAGATLPGLRRLPACHQVFGFALVFAAGERWIELSWLGIPVALVGHSQASLSGVAQIAVLAGVPLLTGWVVAINYSIVLAIKGNQTAGRIAVSLFVAWFATAMTGLALAKAVRSAPEEDSSVSLLIVQPDLPRGERWVPGMQAHILDIVASYTDRVIDQLETPVDAVVWPENLLTSKIDRDPELSRAIQSWVDRWEIPLITGMVRSPIGSVPGTYRSSVLWLAPNRGVVDTADKVRAIPLIESSSSLPAFRAIAPLLGRAALGSKVEEARSATALKDGFEFVPVLCYEALFPDLVAKRRGPESLVILNLADDSWVASPRLSRQLVRIAGFRAIEQRISLIRLAHGGLSAVISPFGERLAELPLDTYAYQIVTVRASAPADLFDRIAISCLPILTGVSAHWISGLITNRRAVLLLDR